MKTWKDRLVVLIIIVFILVFSILGLYERKLADEALKNSDTVIAVITKKEPGRDESTISVKYLYKDTVRKSEYETTTDSFKIGDKILLKVAKKYPDKYVRFVHKIK
jgi:hypothetical protein